MGCGSVCVCVAVWCNCVPHPRFLVNPVANHIIKAIDCGDCVYTFMSIAHSEAHRSGDQTREKAESQKLVIAPSEIKNQAAAKWKTLSTQFFSL